MRNLALVTPRGGPGCRVMGRAGLCSLVVASGRLVGGGLLVRRPHREVGAVVAASVRRLATDSTDAALIRNIGISAHIDSGKTTLTERILFYTGRIDSIHEVRGKDGVGATMDSMDLEREKGITIQSAATFCQWGDASVNIIDTPGHVDFTVEVERALRVLDGAVMVLCGVGGVQSQSLTVDRQMRRYAVPRISFINKLDRVGSNPVGVVGQIRTKLRQPCELVQLPIGVEDELHGLVDVVTMEACYFDGEHGETVRVDEIPSELRDSAETQRAQLVEAVADFDEELAELFLADEVIDAPTLKAAIRRATLSLEFSPVFLGSALKNFGIQTLLDGVVDYLPQPEEVSNVALKINEDEEPVELNTHNVDTKEFVALAFKLEETRFGQLTYIRAYQGSLRKGAQFMNVNSGSKKERVPRLVRMHANEMEDIAEVKAGEIAAVFGVDCNSGDTFTTGLKYTMTSMFVPPAVVSLAINLGKGTGKNDKLATALGRFQKEDPTFRVGYDSESEQTLIRGMGELHLEIYVERLKREYGLDVEVGAPQVNFREAITQEADFDYLHKKQTGGSGQYGRVVGRLEPLPPDHPEKSEFANHLVGNAIPPEFVAAIQKGFEEAVAEGPLVGAPIEGVRMVITDGKSHEVDSSEIAFRTASMMAFRQGMAKAEAIILEPIMQLSIEVPSEFQGNVVGDLNKRKGMITSTATENDFTQVEAEVPLKDMFGYANDIRSMTQGKGDFSMEYKAHQPVPAHLQDEMIEEIRRRKQEREANN
jgi:elongation factor G